MKGTITWLDYPTKSPGDSIHNDIRRSNQQAYRDNYNNKTRKKNSGKEEFVQRYTHGEFLAEVCNHRQ